MCVGDSNGSATAGAVSFKNDHCTFVRKQGQKGTGNAAEKAGEKGDSARTKHKPVVMLRGELRPWRGNFCSRCRAAAASTDTDNIGRADYV